MPFLAAAQQSAPIIVKIVETPGDPTGLAGVLIGALGLTGALVLLALVLGAVMGGILYFARSRRPLS
jgi:membrane protein DedA with SNARE-associated domain